MLKHKYPKSFFTVDEWFLRIEEIKRIQTIPDSYELCGDFKEQWRQVGNAVPSAMAYVMAKAIKEAYFNGSL